MPPASHPGHSGDAAALMAYRSATLCRLLPGDTGYTAWAAAKYAFFTFVKQAIEEIYGDESTVEGAARVAEWVDEYPVEVLSL